MRVKINLVTMTDINEFCAAVGMCDADVYLVDSHHQYKVNAKSQISCMLASAEWGDIWAVSDEDIYQSIQKWVV